MLLECKLRREDLDAMVATGYGRKLISQADATVTEITCQAWGVRHCVPETRTIIDIGGQDSKLVRLKDDGSVADFVMNDRCAAGTGRFLEVLAAQLGVKLTALESLVRRSSKPATISSMCVVFAETEIVGLLASGVFPEDILTGVQTAIATRIAAMSGRHLSDPVIFTGGVALVPGMAEALKDMLGKAVRIAPQPQLTCALGAALLAADRIGKEKGVFT
jgi:predicted CoA-substrate-specific enzyme activase